MQNIRNVATALAGMSLPAFGATSSASTLTCVTDNKSVTLHSSSACAPTPNQNDQNVDKNSLVFQPGSLGPWDWSYLDKDNRSGDTLLDDENNQIAGAAENWFTGTTSPGDNLTGTFSVMVDPFMTLGFNIFMIYIKAGNDGVFFLLDGAPVNGVLTGSYSITRNGISHMSLYGRYEESECGPDGPTCNPPQVPEPGMLALLGLGLAGLGMARRRKAG